MMILIILALALVYVNSCIIAFVYRKVKHYSLISSLAFAIILIFSLNFIPGFILGSFSQQQSERTWCVQMIERYCTHWKLGCLPFAEEFSEKCRPSIESLYKSFEITKFERVCVGKYGFLPLKSLPSKECLKYAEVRLSPFKD
jgi:hypothetical protein